MGWELNQHGMIAGLVLACIGYATCYMFCMSSFNAKSLNNSERLCVALVFCQGLFALVSIIGGSFTIANKYQLAGGFLGTTMCRTIGFCHHCLGGLHLSMQLTLVFDRWNHTIYHAQLTKRTTYLLALGPFLIYVGLCGVALAFEDGYEPAPSGVVCTIRSTLTDSQSPWPVYIFGMYCILSVLISMVVFVMYLRLYTLLRNVKKKLAHTLQSSKGTDVLLQLLKRCVGVLIGFWVSWTPLLVLYVYSVISKTDMNPVLNAIVLLSTIVDPILAPVILMVMNPVFLNAFYERYFYYFTIMSGGRDSIS